MVRPAVKVPLEQSIWKNRPIPESGDRARTWIIPRDSGPRPGSRHLQLKLCGPLSGKILNAESWPVWVCRPGCIHMSVHGYRCFVFLVYGMCGCLYLQAQNRQISTLRLGGEKRPWGLHIFHGHGYAPRVYETDVWRIERVNSDWANGRNRNVSSGSQRKVLWIQHLKPGAVNPRPWKYLHLRLRLHIYESPTDFIVR